MKHTKRAWAGVAALLTSGGIAALLFLLNHGATILLASGPDRHVSDRAVKAYIEPAATRDVLARLLG